MHNVCELHSFRRAAGESGMADSEVRRLIDFLSQNPQAGDEIAGTGGCRKPRWAGRGRGKSAGYRVVTFHTGISIPTFLITAFSKGSGPIYRKANGTSLRRLLPLSSRSTASA